MSDISLSASRIKTLETCSWQYYCKYVLKLPDPSNSGALRGSIVHLVFEVLFNSRHKKHYNKITKNKSVDSSKAILRLIKKHAEKTGINDSENISLIKEMILTGLKTDFYPKGGKVISPEYEFNVETPTYKTRGFIDLPIKYEKKKEIVIRDYKTSKKKFSGEELTSNTQALMYSLISKKIWPEYKPKVEFIFVKFPKSPVQCVEFSDMELEGFEIYIGEIFKKMNNFTEDDAYSNFAKNKKSTQWLCGNPEKPWVCPFYQKKTFYRVENEDKTISKTFLDENEAMKFSKEKNIKMKYIIYNGCPVHA